MTRVIYEIDVGGGVLQDDKKEVDEKVRERDDTDEEMSISKPSKMLDFDK